MKTQAELWQEASAIIDTAAGEERGLTDDEQRKYDGLVQAIELLNGHDQRGQQLGGQPVRNIKYLPGYEGPSGAPSRALTRHQQIAEYVTIPPEQRGLSVGKYIRGVLTGNWQDAAEERAMSIGSAGAGGYLVPTPLAANVIDLARNKARVMQAGAMTVPMTASTLKLARITGDPTAAWRAEGDTINPSDASLDVVTLTAHTLAAQVKFSRELFEDVENLDEMLTTILAQDFALEIDRAALYGSGSGAEPTGLGAALTAASISSTSMGASGGAFTDYSPFVDAIYAVENANFEPNATIYAPRTQQALSKLQNTLNDPLGMPAAVQALTKLVTKQVPINLTQGSANNASDAWVGQWDQLLIGLRTDFNIQLLSERYADTGQYAVIAWLRGDIQFAHVAAFNRIQGIIP